MAVSKRARFEVLRRDGFTCRYCRSTDGKLTIDHVTPIALGGTDDPANLVAACEDCNSGKSSIMPGSDLVDDVAADAERWSAAIRAVAEQQRADRVAAEKRLAPFLETWRGWDAECSYLPGDWRDSVNRWLESGLPMVELRRCLCTAIGNRTVSHDRVFAYMGGIARNKIAALHEAARAMLARPVDEI